MKAVAAFVLAASLASPAVANCRIEPYKFFFGSDTSTTGVVTGGSTCTIHPSALHGAGFQSVVISQPAKHGRAATNGSTIYTEITYKPAAGYKGPDEFVFTVTGGGKRLQGASNIRVTMDVQ